MAARPRNRKSKFASARRQQRRAAATPQAPSLEDAHRLFNQTDFAGAIRIAKQVVERQPRNTEALTVLGHAQSRIAKFREAVENLEKAISINPRLVEPCLPLAWSYHMLGRTDDALATYEKALAMAPDNGIAIASTANMLRVVGRTEEADELIVSAVERGIRSSGVAVAYSKVCESRAELDKAVEPLEAIALDDSIPPGGRLGSAFRLAEVYERLGRYDDAWQAYHRANALRSVKYDRAAYTTATDNALRAWTPEVFHSAPRATPGEADPVVVFVLGMPRSGTSLIEQVLDAHPAAHGLGEVEWVQQVALHLQSAVRPPLAQIMQHPRLLSKGLLENARREYFRKAREKGAGEARFITDKLPPNFFNIGLITRMFPDARIIHTVRDPLDTCLSCYFHSFGSGMAWPYDLRNIAHFYNLYRRMMDHWRSMPDLEMLDVVYEEFVADQESQTRRLLEFVGLEWDDACMTFHESGRVIRTASMEQANRPIYTSSVKRHERFGAHLDELRAMLGLDQA